MWLSRAGPQGEYPRAELGSLGYGRARNLGHGWACAGVPGMCSLAAVGVQDPIEEFHAHDGEGVVKDEQGEAQAVGKNKGVTGGPGHTPPGPPTGQLLCFRHSQG